MQYRAIDEDTIGDFARNSVIRANRWLRWALPVLLTALLAWVVAPAYAQQGDLAAAQTVAVPDVRGMSLARANAAIKGAGLIMQIFQGTLKTTDPNKHETVAKLAPAAGTLVAPRSSVTVYLYHYGGAGKAVAPNVVGMDPAAAQAAASRAGLKPQLSQEPTADPATVGRVMRQVPPGGTSVTAGSTIFIVVGAAPVVAKVRVPNLQYMTAAAANAALAKAGLRGEQMRPNEATHKREDHGKIARQVPAAGTIVSAGSTVTVKFYEFKDPISTVPIVLAMSEADARRALSAAGFNVVIQRQKTPLPNRWDKVMAQSPAGGLRAARGVYVNIVIGVK